jgi:peroxiredoxin
MPGRITMRSLRILLVLVFAALPCSGTAFAAGKDLPPDFTFTSLDGKMLDYAALKGSPVVMAVGAAWCPECRAEAPEMEKAFLAYKDKGVVFFGVFGNSSDDEIRDFVETYRLTFPVGRDSGIVEAFGVRVIPQTFIFAKDGTCVKRIMGTASYKEIVRYIEKSLEAK